MVSKELMKVDRLRTEHECDEHWKLRRLFLLKHKKKFTKDRLLCLAQVFINVEVMGCRYPKETMDLVASLAAELPDLQVYREKRKHKLKRTFVRASDAAATRAKGRKKSKTTRDLQDTPSSKPFEGIVILQHKYQEHSESFFIDTATRTLSQHGVSFESKCTVTKSSDRNYKCDVTWEGVVVCSVDSQPTENAAKRAAAKELLMVMRNHCYTLESLKQIVSSTTVEKSSTSAKTVGLEAPIGVESKGNKMLRMMGWSGGGLGKNGQGIADPVRAVETVNRGGLGLETLTMTQCFQMIRKCLDQFIADESAYDLEFASDFTREERAEIHSFVKNRKHLKSKSHGKGDSRRLVVSKKVSPYSLVLRLIEQGGTTEKYNVIWPLLSPKEPTE